MKTHIEATTKGEKWLHKLLLLADCVCSGRLKAWVFVQRILPPASPLEF